MSIRIKNLNTEIAYTADENAILKASKIIKSGGLVAFPTETVYGLGANGLDPKAVKKIFRAKGRPAINPLIIHLSTFEEVQDIAKDIPDTAYKLAEKFMPGPLTLILKKRSLVPNQVTANRDTVAIRIPNHIIAQELIKKSGIPIAAPSANLSQTPSGTSLESVIQDFNGKIDMIINGGDSLYGVESTIVDMTGKIPILVRPGFVTLEDLKHVIGHVQLYRPGRFRIQQTEKRRSVAGLISPGLLEKHYCPKAQMYLVNQKYDLFDLAVKRFAKYNQRVGILSWGDEGKYYFEKMSSGYFENIILINLGYTVEECLNGLFSALRKFDKKKVNVIFTREVTSERGLYLTLKNRLYRAAGNQFYK